MKNIIKIFIPNETSANSVGADSLYQVISKLINDENIEIIRNGSWGAFWLEPFIEIEKDGIRKGTSYRNITISHLNTIEEFFVDFEKRNPFDINEIDFIKKQNRIVFSRIGHEDPLNIEYYKNTKGYQSLLTALEIGPQKTINRIKESGLTGRGGAGFPTGIKMQTVFDQDSSIKYLACNADEGDGGTFSDRLIMESDPFALIEGMVIAAYAVGLRRAIYT